MTWGQMVDALLEMGDIAKHLKKLQKKNMDYVILDAWKENRHFTAEVGKETSNEEVLEEVKRRGVSECEIRRYRGLESKLFQTQIQLHLCSSLIKHNRYNRFEELELQKRDCK